MARPVVDLPEPDFADDAEPLAAQGEGDVAHGADSAASWEGDAEVRDASSGVAS